jgi:hypothetical protein
MATQTAARLADEFVESYPKALPARLGWLADNLRLGRPRLLRLLGLTPDEVEANLDTPWETIAARWPHQALWISQILVNLIASFGYNWRALAERFHQPAPRPDGQADWPVAGTRCSREEVLLALIHRGGRDILDWLIEYLMPSATDGVIPPSHK